MGDKCQGKILYRFFRREPIIGGEWTLIFDSYFRSQGTVLLIAGDFRSLEIASNERCRHLSATIMKASISIASIILAISALAIDTPPPQLPIILGIVSDTPGQCSPGQSINISFLGEGNQLRIDLPNMRFGTEGHGRTDEHALCQFTVEFTSWWYKYRFSIQDVTYKGHLNSTIGVQLYQLTANTVFRYENRKLNPGRAPPDIWNLSTSTMVSLFVFYLPDTLQHLLSSDNAGCN